MQEKTEYVLQHTTGYVDQGVFRHNAPKAQMKRLGPLTAQMKRLGGDVVREKCALKQSPGDAKQQRVANPSFDPLNGFSGGNSKSERHIGAIVSTSKSVKLPPKVRVKGYRSTDNVERCALDSGACESALTPQAFGNTQMHRGKCTGMKYLA